MRGGFRWTSKDEVKEKKKKKKERENSLKPLWSSCSRILYLKTKIYGQ